MRKILIDTQEKKPLVFKSPSISQKLKYGDYSLKGLTRVVSVERKGAWDWARCNYSKSERARLQRQLTKLCKYVRYPLLLIEMFPTDAVLHQVMRGLTRDKLFDHSFAWMGDLPVLFASTPEMAAMLCEAWLFSRRCWNCQAYLVRCTCEVHEAH